MELEGRVALVTGAGSGMGRAIVHRLARDGLAVAILDVNADAAAAVEKEVRDGGNEALAMGGVDVSERSQVEAAMAHVREALGPIVVLVNNAGITGFREFLKITDEKWDRIMAVNLNGPFYLCRAFLPGMAARGAGAVVNVSSLAGRSKSANGGPAYSASSRWLSPRPRSGSSESRCPGSASAPSSRRTKWSARRAMVAASKPAVPTSRAPSTRRRRSCR